MVKAYERDVAPIIGKLIQEGKVRVFGDIFLYLNPHQVARVSGILYDRVRVLQDSPGVILKDEVSALAQAFHTTQEFLRMAVENS